MEALRDGTVVTDGAYLTYQQVREVGDPREPLSEEDYQPDIERGELNTRAMVIPYNGEPPTRKGLFLVKSENPKQAYMLNGKPSIRCDHYGPGWGEINYAVLLPRVVITDRQVLTFQAPDPSEARLVVIKTLNKAFVNYCLAHGAHENPYKEAARMQKLGDGIHIVQCIECLEDEKFLYIVTPYSQEGTLLDNIPWDTGYPEAEAQAIFKNILEILLYLESHGIFHHDLSPDNFLFFQGRLLLFDFAMSIRIPREPNGDRYLMKPQGTFGTFPCQAPEVFANQQPFDGVFADLWASATILYSLLTGRRFMYRHPHAPDILFRYYIMYEGLRPEFNDMIFWRAWGRPGDNDQTNLIGHALANMDIPPAALELLMNLLKLDPDARWTLMQAVHSDWVQS